jgi:translation initiation factor IF-3
LIKPNDRSFAGREMRVVGADGEQIGIIKYEEARERAKAAELDLVLVAEKSDPPVCRIMDFGKLVYEQKKKVKDQKKHHHAQKLKEIKFHVNIDTHDYDYKINHGIEFLEKGNKLKVTIAFRGREMAHKEMGFELIKKVTEDLLEYGTAEVDPKLLGRNISVTFAPTKGHGHK